MEAIDHEARALIAALRAEHEGHTVLCTERWTESRKATHGLQEDVREVKGDVKAMRSVIDQSKGGWRVIALIGGCSAAIGGLAVKFVPFLR